MNITEKKEEIKSEIDKLEDEKLLWAIARLLHLDDEGDIPDWHKQILKETEVEYVKGNLKMKDWEMIKDTL